MNGDVDALLSAARAWVDAGFSTLVTHADGRKRPAGGWEAFQFVRPTWNQVEQWITSRPDSGIGVVLGTVSGNRELLEIEGPGSECEQRLAAVVELAGEAGCGDVLDRILSNLCETSAGGGLHMFLEVIDGPCRPNTKLASHGQGEERHVVAETRGEGGFAVVAPTTGRVGHEPGSAYKLLPHATPERVARVTMAERDLLYAVVTAALNEPTPADQIDPGNVEVEASPVHFVGEGTPWDAWAAETSWSDILEPLGWSFSHRDRAGRDHWTRPGKDVHEGTSATTISDGPLYIFSSSTSLPAGQGLSKFFVYAHVNHHGDMSAAARALRDQGFGDALNPWQLPPVPLESVPSDGDYDKLVRQRYIQLKIAEDAKKLIATERAAQAPELVATGLTEFLAEPDAEERFRVQGLWPSQGRVLLAAAAKSGKTTMVVGNLLPALVDGEPFLGTFDATVASGRVAYLNMEVGETVIRQWMRDVNIRNTDRIVIANLRGRAAALSLDSDAGRRRLAETLRANNVEVVILDPLAPLLAALGIDENSNADVARFFSYWNEALVMGGVQEDFIVHHTGHGGQRSRGASRLLDEPDAIWTLMKNAEDSAEDEEAEFIPIVATRHLKAYGRDVDLPPTALAYEESNRRLLATGPAPRKAGKKAATAESQKRRIIEFVHEHPGANTRRISGGAGIRKAAVPHLLRELVEEGVLDVLIVGAERLYTCSLPQNGRPPEERPASPVPETRGWGTGDVSGFDLSADSDKSDSDFDDPWVV